MASKKTIDPNQPLTAKQQAFCRYYIECNNGTEAAIKAGYKETNAVTVASENLSKANVRAEITRLKAELQKSSIATGQEVMEYFTKVMNGEIKDQFGLDAPLSERTKAAQELAKRTVDWDNRAKGNADAVVQIKLDWTRE